MTSSSVADELCREVRRVLSEELRNRESQRAIVAAKLARLKDAQRKVGRLADVPTQAEAAGILNVCERSVRRAREVIDAGAPNAVKAVERAERRAGEFLAEMKAKGERQKPGDNQHGSNGAQYHRSCPTWA